MENQGKIFRICTLYNQQSLYWCIWSNRVWQNPQNLWPSRSPFCSKRDPHSRPQAFVIGTEFQCLLRAPIQSQCKDQSPKLFGLFSVRWFLSPKPIPSPSLRSRSTIHCWLHYNKSRTTLCQSSTDGRRMVGFGHKSVRDSSQLFWQWLEGPGGPVDSDQMSPGITSSSCPSFRISKCISL